MQSAPSRFGSNYILLFIPLNSTSICSTYQEETFAITSKTASRSHDERTLRYMNSHKTHWKHFKSFLMRNLYTTLPLLRAIAIIDVRGVFWYLHKTHKHNKYSVSVLGAIKAQFAITLNVRLPLTPSKESHVKLMLMRSTVFWMFSEMKTNIKNRVVFRVCTF